MNFSSSSGEELNYDRSRSMACSNRDSINPFPEIVRQPIKKKFNDGFISERTRLHVTETSLLPMGTTFEISFPRDTGQKQ